MLSFVFLLLWTTIVTFEVRKTSNKLDVPSLCHRLGHFSARALVCWKVRFLDYCLRQDRRHFVQLVLPPAPNRLGQRPSAFILAEASMNRVQAFQENLKKKTQNIEILSKESPKEEVEKGVKFS